MPKKTAGSSAVFDGPVLLDTHVWIWYLEGRRDAFSESVLARMKSTEKVHFFWVSEMSVWEAANKAAKGRLDLSPTTAVWIAQATQQAGYRFTVPDRETYLLSTGLPSMESRYSSDPVDRILMATAMLKKVPLVTADRQILDYAKVTDHLTAFDVRGE
jgi:PIN domain nuclease of toxin-antitoxin system